LHARAVVLESGLRSVEKSIVANAVPNTSNAAGVATVVHSFAASERYLITFLNTDTSPGRLVRSEALVGCD
jgi:hypothetical protein